jgi:hypothetical protein
MKRKQIFMWMILTAAGGMLGGLVGSGLFSGRSALAQKEPEILTARQFRLVDEKGTVRGIFGINKAGQALVFGDGKDIQIIFGMVDGKPRLSFFHKKDKEPGLAEVVSLTVQDGEPLLSLKNRNDDRALMGILKDTPLLHLTKYGNPGCLLKVEEETAKMVFSDKKGEDLLHFVVRKKGNAAIGLGDDVSGLDLVSIKDLSLIRIREKGKVVWSASTEDASDRK